MNPVLLGGRSLFAGLKDRVDLIAGAVTVFRSGNVLLRYWPPGGAAARPDRHRRRRAC